MFGMSLGEILVIFLIIILIIPPEQIQNLIKKYFKTKSKIDNELLKAKQELNKLKEEIQKNKEDLLK